MHSQQNPPALRPSICERISFYIKNAVAGLVGFGGAIPNTQYAATFPLDKTTKETVPTQVSFTWLSQLSPGVGGGAAFNSSCTFAISGTFGYRFLKLAASKLQEELLLFRQGKNVKRFVTETTMSFLAAIAGSSIAGGPFTGAAKWAASFLGFVTLFGMSFLGMCELIIKLTDEDYALKLRIIDNLKRLNPDRQNEINALLAGKELNTETLKEFLIAVRRLAVQIELQNQSQQMQQSLIRKKTDSERQKEYGFKVGDYAISATLAGMCNFIYVQSGFSGMNTLTGGKLEGLPLAAKILIGIPPGLPLTLFAFFTIKFFNSPLVQVFPEIKDDVRAMIKAFALVAACGGNATWYYGLANLVSKTSTIFLFLLDSDFGQIVFPWAAYLTCLNMGINGIVPMMFPPKINTLHPKLTDVIKTLEHGVIPSDVIHAWKRKHLFAGDQKAASGIMIEVLGKVSAPKPL